MTSQKSKNVNEKIKSPQVISKERVSDFGEVYTSEKEVNDMLNLVQDQTERIDSRFLEPACGNGNFLSEILKRKLKILNELYKKNQYSFDKFLILLTGSLYGVDIIQDNVIKAQKRLFEILKDNYIDLFNSDNEELFKNIQFILRKNIVCADALTFLSSNKKKPLILSEWSLIDDKIKRRDFEYKNLVDYSPFEEGTLFSDLGEEAIIPNPIKEYPLINFLKLYETREDT